MPSAHPMDPGFVSDYLIDSTLTLNGGSRSPDLTLDASQGFTLLLTPPSGQVCGSPLLYLCRRLWGKRLMMHAVVFQLFSVMPPKASMQAQLHIMLQWCTTWDFPLVTDDRLLKAVTTVTAMGVRGNSDIVFTSDAESAMMTDGSCLAMVAHSGPLGRELRFQGLAIALSIASTSAVFPLSFVGNYRPIQPSVAGIFLSVVNSSVEDLSKDPGQFVFVKDMDPPTIANCPGDIAVAAETGAASMTVDWTTPQASDNVGVVSFTESVQPGRFFSIRDSPHTVIYVAKDAAGLSTTCSFTVTVTFQPLDIHRVQVEIPISRQTLVRSVSRLGTLAVSNYLEHGILPTILPALQLPIGPNSSLAALELSLMAPPGEAFSVTVPNGAQLRLGLELYFSLDGQAWKPVLLADNDAFCSLDLENLLDVDGNTISWDPRDSFINGPFTSFQSAEKRVVIEGHTRLFRTSFSFTAMHIRLNFPLGRQETVGPRRSLLMLSPTSASSLGVTVFSTQNPIVPHNMAEYENIFSLADVMPPEFAGCVGPAPVVVASNSSEAVVAWDEPNASDNRGVVGSVNKTHEPGSFFPVGDTDVVYTAADEAGNVGFCQFTVRILDKTPPSVTCHSEVVNSSTHPGERYALVAPTSLVPGQPTDNSRQAVSVMASCGACGDGTEMLPLYVDGLSTKDPINIDVGMHEVSVLATDTSGNLATCNVTVLVRDEERPVFTNCPTDPKPVYFAVVERATGGEAFFATPALDNEGLRDVQDNVGVVKAEFHPAPGTFIAPGIHAAYVVIADAAGNSETCHYTLTVTSTESSQALGSAEADNGIIPIGAGVGSFLVLLLLLTLAILYRRRRRRNLPADLSTMLDLLGDIQVSSLPVYVLPPGFCRPSF